MLKPLMFTLSVLLSACSTTTSQTESHTNQVIYKPYSDKVLSANKGNILHPGDEKKSTGKGLPKALSIRTIK